MKNIIIACIDGSAISTSVCDMAAWASALLDNAPVKLLHVLEKINIPAGEDLSGAIGLGSREHLLEQLAELDEQRSKLAIEHGKHILEEAAHRARAKGAVSITVEQRHDRLLDTLTEFEEQARLFVIGRLGVNHAFDTQVIGSHVENVVRAIHTPILMATDRFSVPANYMVAYDGSSTADKAIARLGTSPLLKDLPGHVVMVGQDSADNLGSVNNACAVLAASGYQVHAHLIQGQVPDVLMQFQKQFNIQLKVMGAYGHSRIRELFLGSNTTRMLATSTVPVLILR